MAEPRLPADRSSDRRTRSIEVFAPARVDLAGGTLDLWPLYCFHPGSVTVNVALRRGIRLRMVLGKAPRGRIRHLAPARPEVELGPVDASRHLTAAIGFHFVPNGGLSVEVLEQPPLGSGLGGSSALAVALAHGCLSLIGKRLPTARLVTLLRDLEAGLLGVPTGVQDYLPALLGGPLAIHLHAGGEQVERLGVDFDWVEDRLLVVFSGITHASGMVNWDVYRARVDGDRRVSAALDRIAAAARTCREALVAQDEMAVGEAIAAEWRARRELAPTVSTPELDAILVAGVAAGAYAGKACGAGGGGSVLFWSKPTLRLAVRNAALAAAPPGSLEIAGGLSANGARVTRIGPAPTAATSGKTR